MKNNNNKLQQKIDDAVRILVGLSKPATKPYPGDRVWTPWSAQTRGTVAVVKLAHAAMLSDGGVELSETENPSRTLCFVMFDKQCGPGPDSQGWFDSRDVRIINE